VLPVVLMTSCFHNYSGADRPESKNGVRFDVSSSSAGSEVCCLRLHRVCLEPIFSDVEMFEEMFMGMALT